MVEIMCDHHYIAFDYTKHCLIFVYLFRGSCCVSWQSSSRATQYRRDVVAYTVEEEEQIREWWVLVAMATVLLFVTRFLDNADARLAGEAEQEAVEARRNAENTVDSNPFIHFCFQFNLRLIVWLNVDLIDIIQTRTVTRKTTCDHSSVCCCCQVRLASAKQHWRTCWRSTAAITSSRSMPATIAVRRNCVKRCEMRCRVALLCARTNRIVWCWMK